MKKQFVIKNKSNGMYVMPPDSYEGGLIKLCFAIENGTVDTGLLLSGSVSKADYSETTSDAAENLAAFAELCHVDVNNYEIVEVG